jgi:hypothetical protein
MLSTCVTERVLAYAGFPVNHHFWVRRGVQL